MSILPEMPCYLVGVRPRRSVFGNPVINEPVLIQRLAHEVQWPDGAYFVFLLKDNKWLRRRMRDMNAALIEQ
jgi:hypothetical protein